MKLKLLPLTHNPFSWFPEFKEIWPHRSDVPEQDVLNYLNAPGDEKKYLIVLGNKPIGITGYWSLEENTVALGWSGIVPSHQGCGYMTSAFELLEIELYKDKPNTKYMIEPMPSDASDKLKSYFERLGFYNTGKVMTHPELYDEVVWIEFLYEL